MRFLLFARASTATSKPIVTVTSNSARSAAASQLAASESSAATTTTAAWGQQCSPSCGCVVRFEATYQQEHPTTPRRIASLDYHAKSLVTTTTSTKAAGNGGLQAVLTAKGRPMWKECTCTAVHTLAQSVQDQLPGLTVARAQNMMEFRATRSSTAFQRTVLKAQQLDADEHGPCFDVVEEALTALLQGRLPAPRRGTTTPATRQPWQTDEDHADQDGDAERARRRAPPHPYEDDGFPFGNVFASSSSSSSSSATSSLSTSTLRLLDLQEEEEEELRAAAAASSSSAAALPRDWVSYVDELYQAEETSASA